MKTLLQWREVARARGKGLVQRHIAVPVSAASVHGDQTGDTTRPVLDYWLGRNHRNEVSGDSGAFGALLLQKVSKLYKYLTDLLIDPRGEIPSVEKKKES